MKFLKYVAPVIVSVFLLSCSTPNDPPVSNTPPVIETSSITDNALDVNPSIASMTFTFDQEMSTNIAFSCSDTSLVSSSEWTDVQTLKLNFGKTLSPNLLYTITLNPASSTLLIGNVSGNSLPSDTIFEFTTGSYLDSPVVLSSTILNGADEVSVDTTYMDVVFNHDMGTGRSISAYPVSAVLSASFIDLRTLRINFNPLVDGAQNRITIRGGDTTNNKDVSGNKLASDVAITFRVGVPYTEAPVITGSSIANGSTGVSVSTTQISITFDHSMYISGYSIRLNPSTAYLSSSYQDEHTLLINFNALDPSNLHTITLNASTSGQYMRDTSGNKLAVDTILTFTTGL